MKTLVVDNGAYSIKAGYNKSDDPLICPNAIVKAKHGESRLFIGPDFKDCEDRGSLFYSSPFQKGYLVNFATEYQVWDRLFSNDFFDVRYKETSIALTDPVSCVPATRDIATEVLLEDFGFARVMKLSSAQGVYEKSRGPDGYCLVVDCGYSFTHIVPVIHGRHLTKGIRRISVGGKILTNQLKEWISYRQMNMLEETYLMNMVKEKCCYVAADFNAEMRKLSKGGIVQDFVLPDFVTIATGYVSARGEPQNPEHSTLQRITMGNERFRIPEILFNPSDIGVHEMGIAESIADCVNSLDEVTRMKLLRNIVLVGGSVQFPGFKERLERELQPLVDEYCEIIVNTVDDPVTHAWRGACQLAEVEERDAAVRWVTRKDYLECGSNIVVSR